MIALGILGLAVVAGIVAVIVLVTHAARHGLTRHPAAETGVALVHGTALGREGPGAGRDMVPPRL